MFEPAVRVMSAKGGREPSEIFEKVADSLTEQFAVVNRTHDIVAINTVALPQGLSKTDVLGKNLYEIYPNLEEQGFADLIKKVFFSGSPIIELYAQHKTVDGLVGFFHRKFIPMTENGQVSAVILIIENVHEARLAQLQARSAELEYKQLIETLQLISFELDATGRFVYVNNVVSSLLGYEPAQLIGKPFTRFVQGDDVGQMWHVFWQIVNQGRPTGVCENRFTAADGRVIHMRWNIHPVYDPEGKVIGCRGVGEDISADAERITQLEEMHNLFRQTFQVSPSSLAIVRAGAVAHMNRAAHRLFNINRDYFNNKPFTTLFVEKDQPIIQKLLQEIEQFGRATAHTRALIMGGEPHQFRLVGIRIRSGLVIAFEPELA